MRSPGGSDGAGPTMRCSSRIVRSAGGNGLFGKGCERCARRTHPDRAAAARRQGWKAPAGGPAGAFGSTPIVDDHCTVMRTTLVAVPLKIGEVAVAVRSYAPTFVPSASYVIVTDPPACGGEVSIT